MPNKLTDTEIKKALEEHYKQVDKGYSTHLEYGGKGDEHEEKYIYMLRDVLDLINRQEEEKQNLKAEKENLVIDLTNAMAKIAGLEKQTEWFTNIGKLYSEIKAEAYKECLEKVKEKSKKTEVVASGALIAISYAISAKNLNNLLNELVGDGDGK